MFKKTMFIFIFSLFLTAGGSDSLFAFSLPSTGHTNLAPVGPPAFVPYDCCCSPSDCICCWGTGPMLTPKGVDMAWEWFQKMLVSQFELIGPALESGQGKITKMVEETQKLKMKQLSIIAKNFSNAQEKNKRTAVYGEMGRSYLWEETSSDKPVLKSSKDAHKKLKKTLDEDALRHTKSFYNSTDVSGRLFEQETDDVSATKILPAHKTFDVQEGQEIMDVSKNIIDPMPVPNITSGLKDTSSGQTYDTLGKLKQAEIVLASNVINSVLAGYAPVADLGEQVEDIYRKVKNDDSISPPQLTDDGISLFGYLDFMSDVRFGSDAWMSGGKGMSVRNRMGILKEVLIVESLLMEVERLKMERLSQISALMALESARDAKEIDEYIFKGREDSISEGVIFD